MPETKNKKYDLEKIEAKLFALSFIQGLAALIALLVQLFTRNSVYEIGTVPFYVMAAYLNCIIFYSIFAGASCYFMRDILNKAFRRNIINERIASPNHAKNLLDRLTYFVIADFFGIALFIFWTGGSEESIYAPILFFITPIVIFIDLSTRRKIFICASCSIAIYLTGMSAWFRDLIPFSETFHILSHRGHKYCLAIFTSLCFIVPVVFEMLAERNDGTD